MAASAVPVMHSMASWVYKYVFVQDVARSGRGAGKPVVFTNVRHDLDKKRFVKWLVQVCCKPFGSRTFPMEVLGHVRVCLDDGEAIRIAQMTDVHRFPENVTVWDCPKGRRIDMASQAYSKTGDVELLESVLSRCKPHLLVFTGDIIDGRPFHTGDSCGWRTAFLKLLEPVNRIGSFSVHYGCCHLTHEHEHLSQVTLGVPSQGFRGRLYQGITTTTTPHGLERIYCRSTICPGAHHTGLQTSTILSLLARGTVRIQQHLCGSGYSSFGDV